jgi:pantoate--beta-alanine ligase
MIIFDKIAELNAFLEEKRKLKATIGFVPTMGALHTGHLSLINYSKIECGITVCSIFVNPNQFNNQEDLRKYPRTPKEDIQMLEKVDCDVLFMPEVNEIYPTRVIDNYDFGELQNILEGQFRPGHFNGVAQVVSRLFEIVKPNKAYFGSKDYQQVLIVKALVQQLNLNIEIVSCPILREPDGLAMSSRNVLLTVEERRLASLIPTWMKEAIKILKSDGIAKAKAYISRETSQYASIKLEYFEVCQPDNLMPLYEELKSMNCIVLIALYVGKIRLIDNLIVD